MCNFLLWKFAKETCIAGNVTYLPWIRKRNFLYPGFVDNNAGNKILSKLNKNCTIHLLLEVIIHFNVYMRQFLTGTISSKDFKIWFKEITEEKKY